MILQIKQRSTARQITYAETTVEVRMKLAALVLTIALSFTLILLAPDPFGWVFNSGLAGLWSCFAVGSVTAIRRLTLSRARFVRAVGYLLGAVAGVAVVIIAIGWSDYHRIAFRRPDAAAWTADMKQLIADVDKLPAGLAARAKTSMVPELERLEQSLPTLDDDQREARLTRAIAALRDGHSVAFPYFPATSFALVPLQIRWFGDGLFITAAPGNLRSLIGQQVTSIAGLAPEQALDAMRPYISADNDSATRVRSTYYMLSPRLWNATGHANDPEQLQLAVQSSQGSQTIELATVSRWRYLWWILQPRQWIVAPKPSPTAAPSYEWRRDNFWIRPMPDAGALYVAFRAVRPNGGETLTAFGSRILDTARSISAQKIIIDVRENSGGDNTLFRGMIKALQGSEFNTKGRLILLTGGGTFSAATNFVSAMERDTKATLIGEPTGSGPNHFGDAQPRTLSRTGIVVFLSTRYHQFGAPDDVRVAHDPEVIVRTSSVEFFTGRDPVLEAALRYQQR